MAAVAAMVGVDAAIMVEEVPAPDPGIVATRVSITNSYVTYA